MTKLSKKSKKKPNIGFCCDWCNKSFIKETTLLSHACEPKRRWDNQYTPSVKIGYSAYVEFYLCNSPPTTLKPYKSYREFIYSKLYISFVKFGQWCIEQSVQEINEYVKWLLKSKIKWKNWTDIYTYREFLSDILRNETPEDGLKRSLTYIQKWSEEQNSSWKDFFKQVNSNQAIFWITEGRISPWLLYNCNSAVYFFERCSEEQLNIIQKIAPIKQWKIRFLRYKKETEMLKEVLDEAGL